MIELVFLFSVKGTVQPVVAVPCTVQQFIAKFAKSEKPVLHGNTSCLQKWAILNFKKLLPHFSQTF
jgi:hypothetical protein